LLNAEDLARIPTLAHVPAEVLREAAALSAEEHFSTGELVHRQGDRCEGLRFLKEGTARLSRIAPD
jgi:hypothetical protein